MTPRLELVDPWSEETFAVTEDPAAAIDPWSDESDTDFIGRDPDIIDPWSSEPLPKPKKPVIVMELVDPWSDEDHPKPPTAAFPIYTTRQ